MSRPSLRERLFSRLIIDPSGCLLWQGALSNGYGLIWVGNVPQRVHRVMWEMLEGPIPEGARLEHVKARGCLNRHCVSIAHLELVTYQEEDRQCGTLAGYRKHKRQHESTCAGCRAANAAYARRLRGAPKFGRGWANRRKMHCPQGHEYTPDNIYRSRSQPNARYCRECKRLAREAKRNSLTAATTVA